MTDWDVPRLLGYGACVLAALLIGLACKAASDRAARPVRWNYRPLGPARPPVRLTTEDVEAVTAARVRRIWTKIDRTITEEEMQEGSDEEAR